MIVTLYLISANVYNSVDAPQTREFSYIEIWMLGTQFPIILALCEYGLILSLKKMIKKRDGGNQILKLWDRQLDLEFIIQKLDLYTMIFSLSLFVVFVSLFLIVASIV